MRHFYKFSFTNEQIKQYFNSALKDLSIAKKSEIPEVKFTYSYNALLKAGIALISGAKGLKVRDISGHHIKIMELMSKMLKDESIYDICNAMRMKRNADLYGGGIFISEKESMDYYKFAAGVTEKIKNKLSF